MEWTDGSRRATSAARLPPRIFGGIPARSGRPTVEGRKPTLAIEVPPKNVIVVVLESVGTRYMSLYGSKYDTTPLLQKEAAHALVFDNFYAHVPYTFCSFMALNFSIISRSAMVLRSRKRLCPQRTALSPADVSLLAEAARGADRLPLQRRSEVGRNGLRSQGSRL